MKKSSLIVVCSSILLPALVGCRDEGNSTNIPVDSSKTTLRVRYCNGGLRDQWIGNVCKDFEEKWKDYSFEEGKKGVQIVPEFIKGNPQVAGIKSNSNDVFWVEDVDYFDAVSKGMLADITDVVKDRALSEPGKKEEKTILSKMYDGSKDYYNLGDASNPKYYAVPAFENSCQINYNVDLFDRMGFYFAKGKTADKLADVYHDSDELDDLFVTNATQERAEGPDGVANTWDDGLPATYADFNALMTYMRASSITPFVWNGIEQGYLTSMALTAWASASGIDNINCNLSWNGTATDLLAVDDLNEPILQDGKYKMLGDLAINGKNAWMLHQSKGLLDTLQFVKDCVSNGETINYYAKSNSPSFTHIMAQEYFMNGKSKGYLSNDIGMLVEGTWWNTEANDQYANESDRLTRRFGIMPIPAPTREQVGKNPISVISDRQSMLFIRNSEGGKPVSPAAKTFLSYMNSDEAMNTFSRYTDMMRLMKYDLTKETLDSMSYYGRQVYEIAKDKNTQHIDWHPSSAVTRKNISILSYRTWGFSSSSASTNPFTYFDEHRKGSTTEYLSKIISYFKSNWSNVYSSE